MNLFGLDISWSPKSATTLTFDEFIRRLEMVYETVSGIAVTPETCEEAPTVQAIVNAITMHISTLPVHVLKKEMSKGRATKEPLPNHPVQRLLQKPNEWQTATSYWLDATSWLVRYGRYYAFKARGVTGPVRRLVPLHPGVMQIEQDDNLNVTFQATMANGAPRDFAPEEIHYVRGRASDGLRGDSPVMQARESIAIEIAAQRFGASFFGNGAMPGMIFKYLEGAKGTNEQRQEFIQDFHAKYSKGKRFRALFLPPGVDVGDPVAVENDKAQFLETRQLQRTIIAGAFGVPPHMVGDLSKGTFNNVEQQSLEFQQTVVLPYVRMFESAMEKDLLTDEDRRSGVIIRFNLDAHLRGDFKTRQEGLNIQRQAGVINANEWREREGMNPRDGGEAYYEQGPSGQNATPPGQRRNPEDPPTEDDDDE